jgi:aquaporin Z
MHGVLGISFIAFAPFVGIAIAVYMFGKISMAHFNPAVTIGFLITKHITKIQLAYYLCAEITMTICRTYHRSCHGQQAS